MQLFHFSSLEEIGDVQDLLLGQNRFSRETCLHPNLPITSNSGPGISEHFKNQFTLKGKNVHMQNAWEGLILCRHLHVNVFLALNKDLN